MLEFKVFIAEFGAINGLATCQVMQRVTKVSHGVIFRAIGDTLAMCPPMIITEEQIDAMFEPMETCLDATLHWAKAEGHVA